jgi:hypothetical protein
MPPRHYASSMYVFWTIVASLCVAAALYWVIPDELVAPATTILKNFWVLLGPIGALSVQLTVQLMGLGEDKHLADWQQTALSELVDQRLRYLWDFAGSIALTLFVCLGVSALDPTNQYARATLVFAIWLVGWTGLLAARLPFLYRDIKQFRWRVARERVEAETRAATLTALAKEREQTMPEMPQPKIINGH